jgi:NAD(P)H-quinone oxidoreductase subunit 4L
MGNGHWEWVFYHYPCPMTADAPLGKTPRPHCLPHAPCPMPHAHLQPTNKFMQLQYFLLLAAALFCIGIFGLITSRNAVRVLMSIELMLNAVNLNLMAFSNFLDSTLIKGQVFTVFVITVAAAEAAVGLAIVLAIYRNRDTVDMEQFNLLKW